MTALWKKECFITLKVLIQQSHIPAASIHSNPQNDGSRARQYQTTLNSERTVICVGMVQNSLKIFFIRFDVVDFYPTVANDLLNKAWHLLLSFCTRGINLKRSENGFSLIFRIYLKLDEPKMERVGAAILFLQCKGLPKCVPMENLNG